jgi:RNA polymerase sigma-70 factor, ECF subfamily
MPEDSNFEDLMSRLRHGDEEAAQQIFQRFAHRLVALARTRLRGGLRGKVDPEDVMQSVFKSFFHRHAEGQFNLTDWDGLWALLTIITLRKSGHKVKQFLAACRDMRREVQQTPLDDDSSLEWQAVAREPTPAEAAVLTDTVELLLSGFDAEDQQIVERCLQGCKAPEISVALGLSERSVYRVLERAKKRLEGLTADASGTP